MHAVRREQRLPAGVRPGDRAGVRVDQGPARADDAPTVSAHHRDVARGRLGQPGGEPRRRRASSPAPARPPASTAATARRPGGRPSSSTSSCPDDTATEKPSATVGAQQRREHRARVGHQRDRPGRHRVALEVADRPHPGGDVDEAHAPAAAPAPSRRPRRPPRPDPVRRPVDDRSGVTARGGDRERRSPAPRRGPRAAPGPPAPVRRPATGCTAGPGPIAPARVDEVDALRPGARSTSVVTRQPNESGRSLAPTTATDRAGIIARSRGGGCRHRPGRCNARSPARVGPLPSGRAATVRPCRDEILTDCSVYDVIACAAQGAARTRRQRAMAAREQG